MRTKLGAELLVELGRSSIRCANPVRSGKGWALKGATKGGKKRFRTKAAALGYARKRLGLVPCRRKK